MNKYIYVMMISLITLVSCSKDDPEVPASNKLTKVSCTKNGVPLYSIDINYNEVDGNPSSYVFDQKGKQQLIYVGNTITMNQEDNSTVTYTLQSGRIIRKEISRVNPYVAHETYTSDEFGYDYNKSNLQKTDWLIRWPKQESGGYDTRLYAHYFNWENGNIVRFTEDKKEMVYTYGSEDEVLRPLNFPFRVLSTFEPVGFELIDPINLFFGNLGSLLPTKAYWYNVPETTVTCAEYSFAYTFLGEYINTMTIEEKNYMINMAGYNTYRFTFEYNYKVK